MSETLAVVITLVVTIGIQLLKPEWFVGWFLDLTDNKFKNKEQSNKIQNSLGEKAVEIGTRLLEHNPDNPVITEATKTIKEANERIKNELKNLL